MMTRKEAYEMLSVLRSSELTNSSVYKMLAQEYDRDLYTGESRLNFAIKSAKPLVDKLRKERCKFLGYCVVTKEGTLLLRQNA